MFNSLSSRSEPKRYFNDTLKPDPKPKEYKQSYKERNRFCQSHTFHSKILDFSRTDNSTSTDPSNGSPTKEVRPKTQTYDVKGGVQN